MKFGMPTLIEIKSIERCAALCAELGMQFVELNMNLPECQPDRLDRRTLRRIAEDYGIFYTIHLDETLNPCDFNTRVAQAYTDTMLSAIEAAQELSAPVLNMHMANGIYFTLPDKKVYLFDEYKETYLQKLAAFRNQCTAAIGTADISICAENCGNYQAHGFIREGLDVLLQSPVFALCFDIGHNAAAGYTDESTIMARSERLKHMHIHDAKEQNAHLSLGDGDIPLEKYLLLAEQHQCRAVLEVKTVEGLYRTVQWVKEKGWL